MKEEIKQEKLVQKQRKITKVKKEESESSVSYSDSETEIKKEVPY
jgi:hypothetical protein